jgi:hypothetical protein
LGDTPKQVSPYVRDPHLDLNLESILLSLLQIPSESRVAITPHPLIGFASEYMHWKALLRGFPLDGVLSTTTHDTTVTHLWKQPSPKHPDRCTDRQKQAPGKCPKLARSGLSPDPKKP